MRIAFVTRRFPLGGMGDGIGVYVWHLARGLAALGHGVTVITGEGEAEIDAEIPRLRVLRCLGSSIQPPIPSDRLNRILVDQGADVVEFPEDAAEGSAFQRDFPQFPTVVRLHAGSAMCFEASNPWWKIWALRALRSRSLREVDGLEQESVLLAHAVSSPTRWMAEQVRSRGWQTRHPPFIVPNPFGGWPASGARKAPSAQIVALPGRLGLLKGAELYPHVMQRVWREVPGAVFHVIGKDGARPCWGSWGRWLGGRIPRSKQPQVVMCGHVPYQEMPGRLAAAAVAAFMSAWESFSYTLVEAMSLGLACVVASEGGPMEICTHGEHALQVARTPAAIAGAISNLLVNRDLAAKMAIAGREHIRMLLAPDAVAKSMMRVYRAAISRTRRPQPEAA